MGRRRCLNGFDDDEVELMTKMSVTADRPINWNVLTIDSARPDAYRNQLEACEKANEAAQRSWLSRCRSSSA